MLERPLAVSLCIGYFAPEPGFLPVAVGVGVFFELLWLDLFPVGTYVPPNATSSVFLSLGLALTHGLQSPAELIPALVLGIALGVVGGKRESYMRARMDTAHNALVNWIRATGREASVPRSALFPLSRATQPPETLTAVALVSNLLLSFVLFAGAFLLSSLALNLLMPRLALATGTSNLSWAHLWLPACVGALVALRIKRALAVCLVACALAMALMTLTDGSTLLTGIF